MSILEMNRHRKLPKVKNVKLLNNTYLEIGNGLKIRKKGIVIWRGGLKN